MSEKDQSITKAAAEYAADAASVRLAIGKVVRRVARRLDEDFALINERAAKPFLRALGPMGNLALGATGAAAVSGVLAPAAAIVAFGAIAYYGVTNALRSEDRFELLAQAKARLDAAGEPTPVALAEAVQSTEGVLSRASRHAAGFWRLVGVAAALGLDATKRAAKQAAERARQKVADSASGAMLRTLDAVDRVDAAATRRMGAVTDKVRSTADQARQSVVAATGRATAPFVGFFRAVSARVQAIAAGVEEGARIYRERVASPVHRVEPTLDQPKQEALPAPLVAEPLPTGGAAEIVNNAPIETSAPDEAQVLPGFVDYLLPLGDPEQIDNRVIAARWELVNDAVATLPAPLEPAQPVPQPELAVQAVVEQPAVTAPQPPKKKLSMAERLRAMEDVSAPVVGDDFGDMPGPEDSTASAPRAAAPATKPAASASFSDEFGAPPGMDDEPTPASRSAALSF